MANRLVSNMYIIDSHQLSLPLPYGTTNNPTSDQQGKMKVKGVVFIPMNTSATLSIAIGNTANVVLKYAAYGSGTIIQSNVPQVDHWESAEWLNVYVPFMSACTACLILG